MLESRTLKIEQEDLKKNLYHQNSKKSVNDLNNELDTAERKINELEYRSGKLTYIYYNKNKEREIWKGNVGYLCKTLWQVSLQHP